MEAKALIRPIVFVVVIGSSVLGLNNTLGDDSDLRKQASAVACGEAEVIAPWRMSRTPFFQSYGFQCATGSVDVTCTRSLYLVGPYGCAWDAGNAPPAGAASARPRPTGSARGR